MLRRHFVQAVSLQDRLAAFAEEARAKAERCLPAPSAMKCSRRYVRPTKHFAGTIGFEVA